jgi:hypothetical protein
VLGYLKPKVEDLLSHSEVDGCGINNVYTCVSIGGKVCLYEIRKGERHGVL